MKRCIGFGEHDGSCENEATVAPAHLWCERCEALRRVHLSKRFDEITQSFEVRR